MHVAFFTFYPLDPRYVRGGIRMVSLNLVEALSDYSDLDLSVIHCHSDVERDRDVRRGNLTIHYRALPKGGLIPNLTMTVRRLIREARRLRPDLVHAHAGHFAYAGVRSGVPTIYTVHGVLPREAAIYNGSLYDRMRYGLLGYYERRALPRVKQLVAISAYVQQAYGDAAHGWERINNPVPARFFDLPDRADPSVILYAGSITEIKDILTLLRAVERVRGQHPHVCLRIAGRVTSPAYAERVQAYVSDHGLGDAVQFLGLLDRDEILEAYSHASVVALSSVQENAPMALVEGMAAGKPVVATRVGAIPDIVRDGETGWLVSPGDDQAMADCLARILNDDDRRRQMGRDAREVARVQFGVRHVARAYYELYQRVLASSQVGTKG